MKKLIALLMALCLSVGMLAGCAKEEKPEEPTPPVSEGDKQPEVKPAEPDKPEVKPAEPEKPQEPYVYYWTRSKEESVLNPHDANDVANLDVVDKIAGMLYYYRPSADGKRAELVPGLAASEPTVAADGVTWTIKMNPDAKWENGEKIDAHTFEYSLKMGLDPTLFWKTGQQTSSNFITIKNAQAYYKQKSTGVPVDWKDVGIKALDDETLQIVTEGHYSKIEVMRHFYLRYGGAVYEPLYQKCISADGTTCDYGTAMDKYMCAGMFKLDTWKKGTEIVMVKNDYWPDADLIHIDKIVSRVVDDEATRLELFEKGQSDSVGLGTNGMAKYGEDPRVMSNPSKTIHTIEVNQNPTEKMYLKDPNFRKALFYAIDRNAIAKLTHNIAAPYFLSTVGEIKSDGTLYRDLPEAEAIVPKNGGYDPELAKKYMDQAFKDNNLDKVTLVFLYTEGNESRRLASEFIQAEYKKIFDNKVQLELTAMPGKTLMATMRDSRTTPAGSWDIGWSGIGLAAENYYPWKKFERYTTTNTSAYTLYANEKVNELYKECLKEENRMDDDKICALTVEMEQAMYDNMTCIPVYQANNYTLFNERIQLPVEKHIPSIGYGWLFSTVK